MHTRKNMPYKFQEDKREEPFRNITHKHYAQKIQIYEINLTINHKLHFLKIYINYIYIHVF